MDLLQFCIIPAIDKLASEVGNYLSYLYLHSNLKISNMFVMGVFLFCRYQRDYSFLEDLLFTRLRKINSLYNKDNFGLHSTANTIQLTKIGAQKHKKLNDYSYTDYEDNNDEQDRESHARIALSGSVIYGTNLRNRLFERVASRAYNISVIMCLSDYEEFRDNINDLNFKDFTVYVNNKNYIPNVFESFLVIPVIQKGSYLTPVSPSREDIDTIFTLKGPERIICVEIEIHASDVNIRAPRYNIDENYERIHTFRFEYKHFTYPIVVKVRPSQTQSYKIWVEYGPNESTESISVQEDVLLKTNYGQYQI
ncbi:unnamed protein product [Mucor hiemalis]